mmetsp:Transcript_29851/g.76673  ORF Transcript_29851/g.76673 Transcript_29851/m.76673 type:complete len:164 (+) Transcript_29851:1-492(+)
MLSIPEVQGTPARSMIAKCFGDFLHHDEAEIDVLLGFFEPVVYSPGAVVWEAGENPTCCLVVVEGELHALVPPRDGGDRPHFHEFVCPGAVCGYMSLLNHIPYVNTVVAPAHLSAGVSVLSLSIARYGELAEKRPDLANAVLRTFLRRSAYDWRDLSRLVAHA